MAHIHHNHSHTKADCSCCEHEEASRKTDLIRYSVSIILFILSFFMGKEMPAAVISASLICGYDLFLKSIKSILKFKFNESVLILIAFIATVCIGEYAEAFLITLLFQIGELTEDYASDKSKDKINQMIDLTTDIAYNELGEKIDAKQIKADDTILIKPGDKVCTDAIIIKGQSEFDTSNITGESIPGAYKENSKILSGYINLSSSVVCRAVSDYSNSTAAKIKDYVISSSHKKANTEKFITKFASIYTPIVIALALLLLIILLSFGIGFKDALMRSLTFMIASCPCALVISIPLSYFGAIGAASKLGILIKGSEYIDKIAKADAIVFDKTGTLTNGILKTEKVISNSCYTENEILKYACALEKNSSHPIAKAITDSYKGTIPDAENVKEIFGKGISGNIGSDIIIIGNDKILEDMNMALESSEGICVYVFKNNNFIGKIILSDTVRNNAKKCTQDLSSLGFNGIYILSGDTSENVKSVCEEIGGVIGIPSLLPTEKTDKLNELKEKHKYIIYVGDGVNDAPSLALSDFGISMPSASGIALDAGDAALLINDLNVIPKTVKLARYATSVVYSNIVFTLLVKLSVLIIAALGKAPLWSALAADVGVMIIAVLRAASILSKAK